MEKQSIKDIIQVTINNLSSIRVPAGLMEEIGMPIVQNIQNLDMCLQMIQEQEHCEAANGGIFGENESKE